MLMLRLEGRTYQYIANEAGVTRQRIQQILAPPDSVRDYVVNKYDGYCVQCGIYVGSSGHVHHSNANGEDEYEDKENLLLLCISCHRIAHGLYQPCPQCGKDILQCKRNIFCSRECYHAHCFIQIPCEVCGQLTEYRKKEVDWLQERGKQQHFFCSRKCVGKQAGKNYGFKTKWDYQKIYQARDDTGFGASKLSCLLNIPQSTISHILQKRETRKMEAI